MSTIPGGIAGIFIAACCAYSVYIISKIKKPSLEDAYYSVFWFSGTLWWLFNGLALVFWQIFPDFSRTIIFFGGVWLGIHFASAPLYILSRITRRKVFHIIFAGLSIILFFLYYFFFLMQTQEAIDRSYVYYNVPGNIPHGYIFGLLMGFFVLICLLVLWRDWKKGKINLNNLSPFYSFYAIILYGAISLPSVLYVRTGILLSGFYIFVPYLIYLSYAKRKKKN
jgi:uncharacterized membrane protein SirB2